MEPFRDRLVDLISQESGVPSGDLLVAEGLMSTGILDSFGLVTVLSFIESLVGDEIPPADLTFDNFDSVSRICSYVERALAA